MESNPKKIKERKKKERKKKQEKKRKRKKKEMKKKKKKKKTRKSRWLGLRRKWIAKESWGFHFFFFLDFMTLCQKNQQFLFCTMFWFTTFWLTCFFLNMGTPKRIWAPRKGLSLKEESVKKHVCPSLLNLCFLSLSTPFLPGSPQKASEQKAKLSKLLERMADGGKELKEKFFSTLLHRGCYEGPILFSFSSSKGFLNSLDLSMTQVSNEGLRLVGSIRTLSVLVLQSCSNFDDGGLSALAQGACSLSTLDLSKCRKITDSGLSHLSSFAQLCTLDLSNLLITNEGANELRGLTKLQRLSLARTKITDTAIDLFVEDFVPRGGGSFGVGLVSLKALKLNFVQVSAQSVLLFTRFPALSLVELFGCWPSENIWDDFQHQLDQHRGNVVVSHMTGKLIMGPPNVKKAKIERESSWKIECLPDSQWNSRQLVALINGSPPTTAHQRSRWETLPFLDNPQTSLNATTPKPLPQVSPNFRLCSLAPTLPSSDAVEIEVDQTTTLSVEPRTTTNRLCLLPAPQSPEVNPKKKTANQQNERDHKDSHCSTQTKKRPVIPKEELKEGDGPIPRKRKR